MIEAEFKHNLLYRYHDCVQHDLKKLTLWTETAVHLHLASRIGFDR